MVIRDNIIDFQEWQVPSKWEDVTLKMYSELEKLEKKDSLIDIVPVLCNKTKQEVMALPTEFLDKILAKLSWMQEAPKFDKPYPSVVIDKQEYRINTESKLKTGEYLAVDTLVKSDPTNYAAMLAILCRKPNEEYDVRFENEVLEERIKFWESKSVIEVMPLCAFFLQLSNLYNLTTQLFSVVEESISLTASNIETSRKDGELSVWQSILLKRRLKHLKHSIERTFRHS